MIKGVHHVSLRANGTAAYEKAIHFYTELLECTVVRTWGAPGGTMLSAGNCILEVMANGPAQDQDGHWSHLAFLVEDVDAIVEKVRTAGYEITMEPNARNLGGSYPIYIAFCRGPLGEEIEFFKEL